ncbi:hypothetical protein HN958_00470 [Candidatus Falkowbacteria bacterium]|jgi:prolyl-tRNA synthetase|nr:hypothetical protein [Candidatus Falkowbacteria bacterium]MBT7006963.1 hypothetical protein [Candidatus Falkowbacteria bacterium]
MRQSKLFTKTIKDAPKDEVSLNAQLLIRGGFIEKLAAGIYSYLPLGLRTLRKVQSVVRDEMDAIDGQEILMPALTPKENWEKTDRWDNFDALYKLQGVNKKDYALGATHEEIVTPLAKKFISSYKDLPMALYQIQDKFRNEVRAKSGLMRGREFSMKDLYSFHVDEADLDSYYEKAKKAYYNVFQRCGLKAYIVEASGGAFTDFSHEYQVFTEYGEDEVYFCKECDRHQNKELVEKGEIKCPYCGAEREVKKAIEVGNIFKLMTRFSNPFNVKYVDKNGKEQDVIMGTYGIGPSRVMGAVVEVHHDDSGIVWPEEIAPYKVHLLALGNDDKVKQESDNLYEKLVSAGVEVLYDDRDDSAGIKFSDSDLLGLPYRVVISKKTLAENQVELKKRNEEKSEMVNLDKIIDTLK